MMTVDDTLGDWKLGTTTKEAFTQKCGEGTATETVYNYTIGMDMEKSLTTGAMRALRACGQRMCWWNCT